MMECMQGMNCPMGMMWLMWLFWIVLIAVVVWVVYLAARRRRTGPSDVSASSRETPLEKLQRNYADGKMSTEEYEERKSKLRE